MSEAENGTKMQFFEGFSWPVPLAFAGPVSAYRFEQGDVLYRDRAAYDAIEGSLEPASSSAIQVLQPPRSARATPSAFDGDRRRSSWESEVTVELVDLQAGAREERISSQGRLMMALWQGDPSWLDPGREAPPMPRSGRELGQVLEQTRPAFDLAAETLTPKTSRRAKARAAAGAGCRFLFVVDLASDASRAKARSVEEALRATGAVERIEKTPVAANVEDATAYHPALIVRGLILPDRSVDEVQSILKGCLYGGGETQPAAAPDAGSETKDRFSVARHGLLESLEQAGGESED